MQPKDTNYYFFSGGQKDYHIPYMGDLNAQICDSKFRNFNPTNCLHVDTDRDMKSVYSAINHASFFYQKYWMDKFAIFVAKVILETNSELGMETAKDQLLLRSDQMIFQTAADAATTKKKANA